MKMLKDDPLVQSCKYRHNRIRVTFKTGLHEIWYHKSDYGLNLKYIPEEPFGKSPKIRIHKDPYGLCKNLYYVKFKEWKKACFYGQRMVLHRLMDKYLKEFDGDFCTIDDLLVDLENVRNRASYIDNNVLYLHNKVVAHGFKLAGLTDLYQHASGFWTARYMIRCLRRCIKLHREMNKITVMWWIYKFYGGRFINPAIYIDIIKYFGLSGMSIADLNPSPSKAIAATLCGCTYHSPCQYPRLESFLGTKFFPLEERCDVVLFDNEFKHFYDGRQRDLGDIAIVWSESKGDNFLPVCPRDKITGITGNLVYRS